MENKSILKTLDEAIYSLLQYTSSCRTLLTITSTCLFMFNLVLNCNLSVNDINPTWVKLQFPALTDHLGNGTFPFHWQHLHNYMIVIGKSNYNENENSFMFLIFTPIIIITYEGRNMITQVYEYYPLTRMECLGTLMLSQC